MDFEKYYFMLPDFIKFNPKILDFSFKFSRRVVHKKENSSPKNFLLNLLFTDFDIKVKGERLKIQLLYLELLRFIDNVCNKYDIDYWLGFGTLLGAVRHGGFIPWDDDIDICMLREDYNKLIDVLPFEINKYPYFKKNCGLTLLETVDKNYFKGFQSVYDATDKNGNLIQETKLNFLQLAWLRPYIKLDIFPMDFIVEGKENYIKKNFLPIKFKFHLDFLNHKFSFFNELELKRKEVGFTYSKTKFFSDSFDFIARTKNHIFEYEKTFPLNTINFEGFNFKCPKDYDHHLKVLYGEDYMSLPNVFHDHNILSFIKMQFNSIQEMNNSFDESISYLNKINDEFGNLFK